MNSFNRHYQQGHNFNHFVAQGEVEEVEAVVQLQQVLQNGEVMSPTLVNPLQEVNEKIHLLVVGEMFCPDCHVNISAFNYITEQQTHIDMAIISREYAQEHLLVELGLTEIKIPLLLVLDKKMQWIHQETDKNLFIERPKIVNDISNFDEIKNNYLAGEYLTDTITEILAMIASTTLHK